MFKSASKSVLINGNCHNSYPQLFNELEAAELQISIADRSSDIVTAAKSIQPDLILLDISHLRDEGLEIAHQLKSDLSTQNISLILIVTLAQSSQQLAKANEEGINLIVKPVNLEEILVRIETNLALRQVDFQLHREIANRHQIETLLKQSQQTLQQQFGDEIWETMNAKQELEISERELADSDCYLAEFVRSISNDLLAIHDSLAEFTDTSRRSDRKTLSDREIGYLKHLAACDAQIQDLVKDLLAYATVRES